MFFSFYGLSLYAPQHFLNFFPLHPPTLKLWRTPLSLAMITEIIYRNNVYISQEFRPT
jgi:hypothetical protein